MFNMRIDFMVHKSIKLDGYFRYCRLIKQRLVESYDLGFLDAVISSGVRQGFIYSFNVLVYVDPSYFQVGCYLSDFLKEYSLYSISVEDSDFSHINKLINFANISGYFLNANLN